MYNKESYSILWCVYRRKEKHLIQGIGVDCTQVSRIEKSMQKPGFLQRIYSAKEREYFEGLNPKHRAESAAANFAAKEAFMKAMGVGLGGFALDELVVLRKNSGQPYFAFEGLTRQRIEEESLKVHLSLTHDGGMAIAFVVVENHG